MDNLMKTTECLRDLMAFHTERVAGYESMLGGLTRDEQHLTALFDAFIRQSMLMKKDLQDLGVECGVDASWLQPDQGRLGLAWSVVKTVFSSRMPNYPLGKCRSGENALLIAYHAVEGSDGLPPALRSLINKQKRDVIAARDWIAHFEGPLSGEQQAEQRLAAVS